jgi:hypothetical protein
LFDVGKDDTVNWREFWKYSRKRENFANFNIKDNQSSDDEDETAPIVDPNAPEISEDMNLIEFKTACQYYFKKVDKAETGSLSFL